MAGYCKIILIGNLGRDPEIRYTQDGIAVTSFSLAVTEKIKNEDRTQWYRVSAFRRLGEICGEYLTKGKQVYIEGRLEANEWIDPEGNKRFFLNVIASEMRMLGRKDDYPETATSASPSVSEDIAQSPYEETPRYSPPSTPDSSFTGTGSSDIPASSPPQGEQEAGPEEDDIPF